MSKELRLPSMSELLCLHLIFSATYPNGHALKTLRNLFLLLKQWSRNHKITAYIQLLSFASGGDKLSQASVCRLV